MTGALGNKDKYMLFVKSTIVLSDCNYQSDCCCLVSSHFCALIYVKCVRIKNKQVITRWWTPSLWLTSAASAVQKQQINFLFQSLGTIGNFKETVNLSRDIFGGNCFQEEFIISPQSITAGFLFFPLFCIQLIQVTFKRKRHKTRNGPSHISDPDKQRSP